MSSGTELSPPRDRLSIALRDPEALPRGVRNEAARVTRRADLSTKVTRGALRWGRPCISVPRDVSWPSQPYRMSVTSALLRPLSCSVTCSAGLAP